MSAVGKRVGEENLQEASRAHAFLGRSLLGKNSLRRVKDMHVDSISLPVLVPALESSGVWTPSREASHHLFGKSLDTQLTLMEPLPNSRSDRLNNTFHSFDVNEREMVIPTLGVVGKLNEITRVTHGAQHLARQSAH